MKRAMTKNQMREADIDVSGYGCLHEEGVFHAVLDYKVWGRKINLLAYFTLEDGRKILASVWKNNGYFGLPECPEGSALILTFKRAKSGECYLKGVDIDPLKFDWTLE